MVPSALLLSAFFIWGRFGSASGSPVLDQVYRDVISIVSPGQDFLTRDSLRSLFNTLEKRVQCGEVSCEKCDLTEAVDQLINNRSVNTGGRSQSDGTISASQFSVIAGGGVLFLTSPALVCSMIRQGRWGEETELFLHKLTRHEHQEENQQSHGHEHENIDIHGLEMLLHDLEEHYHPLDTEGCLGAGDVMAAVNTTSGHQGQEVGAVLGRVLFHVLKGQCFESSSLPEESFFLDFILDHLDSENFTVGDLKVLMRSLNLGPNPQDEHEHGHEHEEDEHAGHDHRSSQKHETHHTNTTWDQGCFSAEELVQIYGLADNKSTSAGLGRSGMARLSPALVQQILSGACTQVTEPLKPDGLTKSQRYLYATIANIIITLTSMFGIVVLLCTSCTGLFQLCIQFCISLAVGSLTGDALLHLLPMFLGIHVHGDESSHSKHSDHSEGESADYIYKLLVVMGGIYFFYLMETIFSLIMYKDKHHHHHHRKEESEPHHCDHGKVLEMYHQEKKEKEMSASKADLVSYEESEKPLPKPKEYSREQRLLPYMVTFSDSIHNFADGLAMGAAFSMSWKSGLATSLAVFCHELPHELGDFAILLHSGVSIRKALLLNVGSAMTSFVGLYIALSVATDLVTQQWIAAITAGLFLYVGLADMLPTMVHISSTRPWLTFLLQNLGLLSGWATLLLLSLYEEKISF
ncbi:zinc transporter ZIP4 [Sphaeramia orbicularis]|uniref:zinc transporter ZIP4 n=1 Tax=Sphaeramia orbicularis TaxID=375764 RepID=UPI00117F7222|nr:zinc transporter ZIP4 [Sphaeramia orbicularis]